MEASVIINPEDNLHHERGGEGGAGEERRRKSETRRRTLPVLFKLPVKLSCASGLLGSTFGIDPPVAYQLQNAAAVYLLANSL